MTNKYSIFVKNRFEMKEKIIILIQIYLRLKLFNSIVSLAL